MERSSADPAALCHHDVCIRINADVSENTGPYICGIRMRPLLSINICMEKIDKGPLLYCFSAYLHNFLFDKRVPL